jgi:hypothetical protein
MLVWEVWVVEVVVALPLVSGDRVGATVALQLALLNPLQLLVVLAVHHPHRTRHLPHHHHRRWGKTWLQLRPRL